MELLADLARATDRDLRARTRALAAELIAPVARTGTTPRRGTRRLGTSRRPGLELDLDATVEGLADRPAQPADAVRWRSWHRPGRAHVLLVDASGSVTGRPLAAAVVTTAALCLRLRPDDELAVIAFWSRPVLLRPISSTDPPASVLDALLDLRGGDTTDLAAAVRLGLAQAGAAVAADRDLVVLTDGRATAGDDPLPVAAAAAATGATLHVLGLSPDEPEAASAGRALAAAGGGRYAPLRRVADAPAAVAAVLDGA